MLMKIKNIIKDTILSVEERFNTIYNNNEWGSKESISGPGSEISATKEIREKLPHLFREYGIFSIIDAPCGDFNWMKNVNLTDINHYTGIDIVKKVVDNNEKRYSSEKINFLKMNLTKDKIPKADLILCRDCLVHFSNNKIDHAIKNFAESGATYLLTTNFTKAEFNIDIVTGDWRKINFLLPPFNFPKPVCVIDEKCPDAKDKCLFLWKISDLKN